MCAKQHAAYADQEGGDSGGDEPAPPLRPGGEDKQRDHQVNECRVRGMAAREGKSGGPDSGHVKFGPHAAESQLLHAHERPSSQRPGYQQQRHPTLPAVDEPGRAEGRGGKQDLPVAEARDEYDRQSDGGVVDVNGTHDRLIEAAADEEHREPDGDEKPPRRMASPLSRPRACR
jgi:hypothetical protein